MNVILFGATGMVGQGALRECLRDPRVDRVLVVGRRATGQRHGKLRQVLHHDFSSFSAIEAQLSGYDACFFCLGVSSAGMTEQEYRRVTYDITMAAAHSLAARNPGRTFIFVSGAGTDSSERGRSMWARVKGATENALLQLPFRAVYTFRPAFIQPLHGITSRTKLYRILYAVMKPLYPVLNALVPKYVTTTERVGRAMIEVARQGFPKPILENQDINSIGQRAR
jgi:uncharacterized protein YbjT (DUF2867 family)